MTDLLSRPVLRVESADGGTRASVVLAALVASGWVAAVGLVSCLVMAVGAWFAADSGSFAEATRIGALGWLVGNGAGLVVDGVSIGLLPLGFVAVVGLMLHRGGRWVVQRCGLSTVSDLTLAGVVMAGGYALAMVGAALLAGTEDAHVGGVRTVVAGLLVAGLGGGSGLLSESGLFRGGFVRLPDDARAAVLGGVAGAAVLVAAGGVLLTVALLVHLSDVVQLAEGLGAGYVGGLVVAVIGMCLVPNAVLCAGAYLAGPGFAVGTGTSVAPGEVALGPLPSFPLLGALPRGGDAWWLDLLVVTPVIAGVVAGVLAQRVAPAFTLDRAALRGALGGLTGGVGFSLLAWLATGSAGPGRLQEVGPDVVGVLAVCAVAGLVGGALGGAGYRWLSGRVGSLG